MKKKAASKSAKRAKASKSPTPSGTVASETPVAPTPAPAAPAEPVKPAKPANSSRKPAASKTSIRYSPEARAEIIQFVRDHDAAKGRGGRSAAVRKFGVTALTLSKWMKVSKSTGIPAAAEAITAVPAPATVKRGRAGRPAKGAQSGGSAPASIKAALNRMLEIRNQIDALTAEFEDLKTRI